MNIKSNCLKGKACRAIKKELMDILSDEQLERFEAVFDIVSEQYLFSEKNKGQKVKETDSV